MDTVTYVYYTQSTRTQVLTIRKYLIYYKEVFTMRVCSKARVMCLLVIALVIAATSYEE